jgi:hypothetical protein
VGLPLRARRSIIKPVAGFRDFRSPVYEGLIAAYLLNEGGGVFNFDNVQNQIAALSGTLNWAQSYQGPVVNFNGGVGAGPASKLDPFTFAFWANFSTNTPTHQVIAAKSDGATPLGTIGPGAGWGIENNASTGIQLNTASGGGVARLFVNANPPLNTWHFYILFWDQSGNTGPPHAGIYVDGLLVAGANNSSAGAYVSDSGHALNIGQYNGATNSCSNAQIACFMAWNRIISPAEAQDLYVATYPAIPRIYRYPLGQVTANLSATASTKAGTLGRKILITLAAAKHTFQGALIAARTHLFTATAHTKQGVLTTFIPPSRIIAAQMLLRTGTLGRAITHKLTATKATFAGALSTIKANLKTLTATAHTKAGALSTNSGAHISAVHALFAGHLSLIVNHNTPPGTCTPVAVCTMPPAISHVEQCEETGS